MLDDKTCKLISNNVAYRTWLSNGWVSDSPTDSYQANRENYEKAKREYDTLTHSSEPHEDIDAMILEVKLEHAAHQARGQSLHSKLQGNLHRKMTRSLDVQLETLAAMKVTQGTIQRLELFIFLASGQAHVWKS
jgi:hypothetical protein